MPKDGVPVRVSGVGDSKKWEFSGMISEMVAGFKLRHLSVNGKVPNSGLIAVETVVWPLG